MRSPDFFIVGGPKCGTTSLAAWLGEHPKVFMSSYKEPHYFNTDDKRVVDTLDYYRSLFFGCGRITPRGRRSLGVVSLIKVGGGEYPRLPA